MRQEPSLHKIDVRLGERSYEVRIAPGTLAAAGAALDALKLGPKTVVIADESVAALYAAPLLSSIRHSGREAFIVTVPPGETSKDLSRVAPLLSFLARSGLGRKDCVAALGGGVVGDLAGFVAAAYLRGIAFVQLPTTLLAMVDSSVGGKTGVNLPEGKNLVGAFHQPKCVLADTATLESLPPRELAAGMAEVIKYGIIADAALFASLADPAKIDLTSLIARSVEIKAEIVAEDEFETTGRRAVLNFGHTLGHAIENAAGYGTLLHGEAVALGIRAAAHLSKKKCGLAEEAVRKIERTLAAHRLPVSTTGLGLDRDRIASALKLDKKAEAGVNRWVLAPEIGRTVLTSDVSAKDVAELLDLLQTPPA